jgi:hypothetical protein
VPRGFAYFCVFYFFDECSEMRRDGRRQSVVPVPQESPDYHECSSPIASGIYVALMETRSNFPTYPVIDPISSDGRLAHGPVPTFSASRSAPSCKRVTVVWVPQLLAHQRGLQARKPS